MAELLTRADGLEVHEVPDGYIVYQNAKDNVCYLNKTAAIVFEFCDGTFDSDEIVSRVAKVFDLDTSSHSEIRECVDSLIKEGLIQSKPK
jgi:Coenzyme PQQ synthesis protein D (PqqD)